MEKIYENYYRILLLTKNGIKIFNNESSERMKRFFNEYLQKEGYKVDSVRMGKNYAFLKFYGEKRPDINRIKTLSKDFYSKQDLWDKKHKFQESIKIKGETLYNRFKKS